MGKPVQEPPFLDILLVHHHIPIPASAGGGHNVLVEGEGDEADHAQDVDDGADSTHALWYLFLVRLGHVDALDAGLDEGGPQPAYHGVGCREGDAAEGEGGDEGGAIALEDGAGEDGDAGEDDGEEGYGFGQGERAGRRVGGGGRFRWHG